MLRGLRSKPLRDRTRVGHDAATRGCPSVVIPQGRAAQSAAAIPVRYGSYGCLDACQSLRHLLLDRGFVYAIARRGGQEMGRQWYDDGKLMKKETRSAIFISVTDTW